MCLLSVGHTLMLMDKSSQLTQLRLDKIIYAVEATAVNTLLFLIYIISTELWGAYYTGVGEIEASRMYFDLALLGLAIAVNLFMLMGNYRRLQKIKKLEKKKYA